MENPAKGEFVLVATPLGNLGDLSPRAVGLLATADAVYCEDTRHSLTLFQANDLAVGGRLHSLHEHNEAQRCAEVIDRVARGETVVLISDAGTPGISDPGQRVVEAVAAAGLRVTTAPGPSAVIAALSISGLPTERFVMEGFVPRRRGERDALFAQWAVEPRTIVAYESPQRLASTLGELADVFPDRDAVVVRELTKLHEDVWRGSVRELAARAASTDVLGEIVLLLGPAPAPAEATDETLRAALREQMANGSSTRDATAFVASLFDVAHRHVYELALALRRESDE